MVKHTPTIGRQQPTNCVSVFDNSVGLALKGLKYAVGVSHGTLIKSISVQQVFTCSKSAMKTLEQCLKFVQS